MNPGRVARHESVNEAVRSYIDAIDLAYRGKATIRLRPRAAADSEFNT